jgi:hypothetical protein
MHHTRPIESTPPWLPAAGTYWHGKGSSEPVVIVAILPRAEYLVVDADGDSFALPSYRVRLTAKSLAALRELVA